MSPFAAVVLLAAVALIVGTEWSRLSRRLGKDARLGRERARRKGKLRVVHPDAPPDSEEFQRAVERDLAALPTIDEHDAKRRS